MDFSLNYILPCHDFKRKVIWLFKEIAENICPKIPLNGRVPLIENLPKIFGANLESLETCNLFKSKIKFKALSGNFQILN